MSNRNLIPVHFKRTAAYFFSALLLHAPLASYAQVASQETVYTYTADGLVETEDGPRLTSDASDIKRHEYDPQTRYRNKTIRAWGSSVAHVEQYLDHNGRGLPETIIDANNIQTKLEYHPRGWLTKVTLKHPTDVALDSVTEYKYNSRGKLICQISPEGVNTIFLYNSADHMEGMIEGANSCTSNTAGHLKKYTLNDNGNIKVEKNYQGHEDTSTTVYTATRNYDELGRLLEIVGNNGQLTRFEYDGNGFVTKQTDIKNANSDTRETVFDSDNHGRLKKITDALTHETSNEFSGQGEIDKVIDARNNETDYDYDAYGNIERLVSSDSGTSTFKYDEADNLIEETDARGITRTFTYDALNRLTSISYPSSVENVSYYYDNYAMDNSNADPDESNSYAVGRLTGVDGEYGKQRFYYDHRGNVFKQKDIIGITPQTTETYITRYTYRLDNQVKTMTYPSGMVLEYFYDSFGRVNKIEADIPHSDPNNNTVFNRTLVKDVKYTPFGLRKEITYENDSKWQTFYDDEYRIDKVKVLDSAGSTTLDWQYYYDYLNNIEKIEDLLLQTPVFISEFQYDDLDRLKVESYEGPLGYIYETANYNYDEVGNRISRYKLHDTWAVSDGLTYSPSSNRLAHFDGDLSSSSDYTPTYDASGNLTSQKRLVILDDESYTIWQQNFYYNQAGRLKQIMRDEPEDTGTTYDFDANYFYNGFNQRSYKNYNMEAIGAWGDDLYTESYRHHYTYGASGEMLLDTHRKTKTNSSYIRYQHREWIYLNGEAIGMVIVYETEYPPAWGLPRFYSDPQVTYFFNDHLGTFRGNIHASGVSSLYLGTAFDDFRRNNHATNPQRMPGQYYDVESGLHYNWHRYYDPEMGRYITSDPLGLVDGPNTYTYALGNPLSNIDSEGLSSRRDRWGQTRSKRSCNSPEWSECMDQCRKRGGAKTCTVDEVSKLVRVKLVDDDRDDRYLELYETEIESFNCVCWDEDDEEEEYNPGVCPAPDWDRQ